MAPLICNLCGAIAEPAPGRTIAASDICRVCTLRVRHRAVGAWMAETGRDPTREGTTLACNCLPAEQKYLFKAINRLLNFDVRPLDYIGLVMDMQDMGRIDAGSIDTFVALHVLNHVENDRLAIGEVARVLRPGGCFLLTVPYRRATADAEDPVETYGREALERYGVADYRYYGLAELTAVLSEAFDVEQFRFVDPLVAREETAIFGWRR